MLKLRGPVPRILYKYVSMQHIGDVLSGDLLFSNLASFRRIGDKVRGDVTEGMNIDAPKRLEFLRDATTNKILTVDFLRFHNERHQEKTFAFCLSTELSSDLAAEFSCDSAIEISDVENFLSRVSRAVHKSPTLARNGLLAGYVEYYHFDSPSKSDVKRPENLAFFKPVEYSRQREYRLVFAQRGGSVVRSKIARGAHSIADEAAAMKARRWHLRIGDLSRVARVVRSLAN